MKADDRSIIHPVIMAVPPEVRLLKGKRKSQALSAQARTALARSADISDVVIGQLDKNDRGAPIPVGGIHWSLSHTAGYVAGTVARYPVGIDIERVQPFTPALSERLAGREEWDLAGSLDEVLFCRYWTAKEAVLKATGVGLGGLRQCRIIRIPDDNHLTLLFHDREWTVSHSMKANQHIATITVGADGVVWHVLAHQPPLT